METATFPQRVIMHVQRADRDNLATIAGQLQAAGRRPTITTILRHALRVAARAAGPLPGAAPEGASWTR